MNDQLISTDIKEIVSDLKEILHKFEAKKVLLAGGKGFLGTYFLKTLNSINDILDKKMEIFVMDNMITSKNDEDIELQNVKFYNADITKKIKLNKEINFVIHSASIASPPIYRKYPLKTIDVNYQGTRNILEMEKENPIESILYISSSEIYGDPTLIPTPESYWGHVSSTGPRACYDESKRLAETACMTFFREFRTPVKIVRPFNVYGPFLNLDDGRVIPDFFKNAIQNSKIIIHSDGTPTRSFCYVTDAITAFLKVLVNGKSGEAYNVGNSEEISMKELAGKIGNLCDAKICFEKSDDENYTTDNPQRRCPELEKINQDVGYMPKITLDEGLKRVYEWYQERE